MDSKSSNRKSDHLKLCAAGRAEFRHQSTLLEEVRLAHQSLPELSLKELDLGVELLRKKLRAPLIVAAMTGGNQRSGRINAELAAICETRGWGFGVGSQRSMLDSTKSDTSFQVRKHAPTALLLGNIGVVQARDCESARIEQLIERIDADALCVHMNPAMELIQAEGDRDFRGCLETFARLTRDLSKPVVAKETGAGFSRHTAQKLREAGVAFADISGAGGTSWVGVETLRARQPDSHALGELLWDWGVPTAPLIVYAVNAGLTVIATGGIRTGLDVACALALGADAAGIARPVLQAFKQGGARGAENYLLQIERELAAVMLLCGARTPADLKQRERVIGAKLREYLDS